MNRNVRDRRQWLKLEAGDPTETVFHVSEQLPANPAREFEQEVTVYRDHLRDVCHRVLG